MRNLFFLTSLLFPAVAAACSSTTTTPDGGGGDGGCIEQNPAVGSACSTGDVLCHPGNPCCEGELVCSASTHTWQLLQGGCACEVEAGADHVTGGLTCGASLTCNPVTQVCLIVNGHLGGQKPTYACTAPDGGGAPSCAGMQQAMAAGLCGCYESRGQVTVTECPP
jgi:hypothetical protein